MKLAALTATLEAAAVQVESGSLQSARNDQLPSFYFELETCLVNILAFRESITPGSFFWVYVFTCTRLRGWGWLSRVRWGSSVSVLCPAAVSGSSVPEWVEFVVVWLPTSNGFLNCIFYFWINRSFRRKFRLVLQRLALALCPGLAHALGWASASGTHFEPDILDNNNRIHERSSSVSSTCTLVTLM